MTDGLSLVSAALREAGVDCVFGVPGTQTVALFEAFRRARLRTVLTSHELAAAFMANGYYRASGRIAAVATIPGPGFTYALTGIAEAYLDSAALLFIVPSPAAEPGRQFQLQRIDQAAIAAPIIKARVVVSSSSDAAAAVHEAVALAQHGGPGPVMLELDLGALERGDAPHARTMHAAPAAPAAQLTQVSQLSQLAERFARAQRPVLLLGLGAFGISDRLRALSARFTIPVVTTPTARGIVPENSAMSIPFDPLRGNLDAVNSLLDRSDLIVGIGCRLGHNGSAGFELRLAPDKFVHVNADATVLDANYPASLAIAATAEAAITVLERERGKSAWTGAEIAVARTAVLAPVPGRREPTIEGAPDTSAAGLFGWLRGALPDDAVVVTDSGAHQILTRRHYVVRSPRGLVCPSDFQSMGYGLPAAIGAKLGAPERIVVAVVGDGGFIMSGLELLTARRERIGIHVVVFNDGWLSQIRTQQLESFGHPHAVALVNPDFATLAASLGVRYFRFADDTAGEIARAFREPEPSLIEVTVGDSAEMRAAAMKHRAKAAARTMRDSGLGRRLMSLLGRAKR